MNLLAEILLEIAHTFALAAPFLLLGLALAGALHVLMPATLVRRWLGHGGLGGVIRAAAIGVPLPVCSCGVVPIAVEMRRQGASQPASISFLTTTPESSADSVLLTWGLMGPVMAIVRPLAAFFTAVIGGLGAMLLLPDRPLEATLEEDSCGCPGDGCSSETPVAKVAARAPRVRGAIAGALRHGFIDMLDELALWIVIGIAAAGTLSVLVPQDLAALGLGDGLLPLIAALLVGVPLYMCASASTPIAAALIAKGLSPGAALVFLLAGPATNAASLVLLARTFGRRFVAVYLGGVATGAVASGLLLDLAAKRIGWAPSITLAPTDHAGLLVLHVSSAIVLLSLLAWRFHQGALRRGLHDRRLESNRKLSQIETSAGGSTP